MKDIWSITASVRQSHRQVGISRDVPKILSMIYSRIYRDSYMWLFTVKYVIRNCFMFFCSVLSRKLMKNSKAMVYSKISRKISLSSADSRISSRNYSSLCRNFYWKYPTTTQDVFIWHLSRSTAEKSQKTSAINSYSVFKKKFKSIQGKFLKKLLVGPH